MSETLVASVRELKLQITAGDGRNVADASFRREVDRLISAVYDDIGAVLTVPLERVFELFVIKVLYVERRGRRADARALGRRGRMGGPPSAARGYFVSTGKPCYRLAADHELAEFTQQRPTLLKLSGYFEVYLDALNELSERYVTGFDFNLIP